MASPSGLCPSADVNVSIIPLPNRRESVGLSKLGPWTSDPRRTQQRSVRRLVQTELELSVLLEALPELGWKGLLLAGASS